MDSLNDIQQQVAYGMLLGDGHIEVRGRAARMHIRHGGAQHSFVDHLHTLFLDWTRMAKPSSFTYHDRRTGRAYTQVHFKTINHPVFLQLHTTFYKRLPNGKFIKHIPETIDTWLTPRVLAYHLMCDGSMQHNSIRLSTHGFTVAECERYVEALNTRFHLHGKVRLHRIVKVDKTYPYVWFPVKDVDTFRAVVQSYVLPMFYYKVGVLSDG